MKVSRPLAVVVLFVLLLSLSISGWSEGGRKKRKDGPPAYPELARRMNLHGVVSLELTVAADGKVQEVKVVGGNPVLAEAAKQAAQGWVYEPASQKSVETVKVVFQ